MKHFWVASIAAIAFASCATVEKKDNDAQDKTTCAIVNPDGTCACKKVNENGECVEGGGPGVIIRTID